MKEGNRMPPEPVNASRRRLLKAAAWATPFCMTGSAMRLLHGYAQTGREDVTELGTRSAVEHIQQGDMSAEFYAAELLKHYNAHKDLNAIITIDEARLLQDARALDQARARGDRLGPLSGLPFIVKDQIDVAGYPTTAGNAMIKGYVPRVSAPVVDTMIKAGGIVFAKANCHSMVGGVSPGGVTSSNRFFGFVRNPYDLTRIPGGSSGGNGAAIAARLVPAGLGEDTGGSVRLPAAFSGIAGLRPSTYSPDNFLARTTRKRYSSDGMVPPARPLDTIGPMARTVADVAFLDAVITGEAVPRISLRDVGIGIPRADYWEGRIFDPGVEKTTQEAFSRLRDAGARLIEIDLNALLELNAGDRLGAAMRKPDNRLADWLQQNVPEVTVEDLNRFRNSYPPRVRSGNAPPPLSAEEGNAMVRQAASQYADVFRSNDIVALAFPTVLIPPPLINSNGDTPGQRILVNGTWVDEFDIIITNLFWGSRLGTPGLNVPAGLTSGLPVGLSLQGLPGDDSRILGLGIAVEAVLGPIPPPPSIQRIA